MTAIVCALLSAVSFYFSLGLGNQWWLAWLAPIPVLWLAFGEAKGWHVFSACWAAMALGGTSVLRAYGGSLPTLVLVLGPWIRDMVARADTVNLTHWTLG
jgi:apolipoprotein N-acyltransferase